MAVQLNPYLNFRDNARQALTFYQTVFGGTLDINTFAEFQVSDDPTEADKVMHGQLNGDNGIVFMAADAPNVMQLQVGDNMKMSLSGDNHALLSGYYDKLCEGGTVTMPMAQAPWGDTFGGCVDKFGISWFINISPAAARVEPPAEGIDV